MSLYFRNTVTGEIVAADVMPDYVRTARQANGRWPLWEETSPADAVPGTFAAAEEIADRTKQAARFGVPISDVSSDGHPKSAASLTAVTTVRPELGPYDPTSAGKVFSAHYGAWVPLHLGYGPNGNDPPFPTWNETTHVYDPPPGWAWVGDADEPAGLGGKWERT